MKVSSSGRVLTNPLILTAGNSRASFDDVNIMMTLFELNRKGRIGRAKLSESLELGEGTMRSILNVLSEAELVDVFQTGNKLTPLGTELINACPIVDSPTTAEEISRAESQKTFIVKGSSACVSNGMLQRDIGMKNGGYGCIVLTVRDNRIMLPPDTDVSSSNPDLAERILSENDVSNGDIIIVGEGADMLSATRASLSAAMGSICPPDI